MYTSQTYDINTRKLYLNDACVISIHPDCKYYDEVGKLIDFIVETQCVKPILPKKYIYIVVHNYKGKIGKLLTFDNRKGFLEYLEKSGDLEMHIQIVEV